MTRLNAQHCEISDWEKQVKVSHLTLELDIGCERSDLVRDEGPVLLLRYVIVWQRSIGSQGREVERGQDWARP